MICAKADIQGSVEVGEDSIVSPTCIINASPGKSVVIGERTILEKRVKIFDSNIGHGNLIETGAEIKDSSVRIRKMLEIAI